MYTVPPSIMTPVRWSVYRDSWYSNVVDRPLVRPPPPLLYSRWRSLLPPVSHLSMSVPSTSGPLGSSRKESKTVYHLFVLPVCPLVYIGFNLLFHFSGHLRDNWINSVDLWSHGPESYPSSSFMDFMRFYSFFLTELS